MKAHENLSRQERAFADALNAANRVLFDAGFKEEMVVQLGLAAASSVKDGTRGEDALVTKTYVCRCWDCVSPGCNAGPCCCMGPAC
jgi:hypothetical protein